MNEDDLINQSESNINAKKKLFSLLKMGQMLGSDFPVSNLDMQNELNELTEILGKEIELENRRNPPPAPPKPFSIASWLDDNPDILEKPSEAQEMPKHESCVHNLERLSALHTCPYKEDIHSDRESLCTCCASCEKNCAMEC